MTSSKGSVLAQLRAVISQITSRDELGEAWEIMKDRDRQIQAEAARAVARTLGIGARVRFTGKRGATVRGEIVAINKKTVIVLADDRQQWRVSATILSADDSPAPAHVQPLATTANPDESRRLLIESAKGAMARYPQYANHFESYMLCRIRKDVRTKMGFAFRKGEIAIFNPTKREQFGGVPTYSVWSHNNQIDTCLPATDFEPIGSVETEAACG